jgi:hypothetical protein
LAWFSLLPSSFAQSPNLTHIIPAAAAPGKSTEVTFFGKNLGGATELWTSFPCEAVLARPNGENEKETGKVTFRVTPAPETQVGIGAVRLATTNGISSLHLFMIDDLPSIAAHGTNRTIAAAQELRPPVAVDGASEPLSFDYFKFAASKGQRITVDVVAARLGSALDPVVRLLDAKGRELVYCDDEPGAGPDSRFVFKAPAAGDYVIELRDANYQGGASYRYRLRVGSFPLASVAFPPVAQGGTEAKFKVLGPAVHGVKPVPVRVPENAVRIPAAVKYPGGEGSGFVSVFGSPLPTFVETEPNDSTNTANNVTIPIAINGRFEKDRDRDFFQFEARKDQRLAIRGRTRSLGSPCDLFLQLQKADGSKLADANVTGANEGALTNTFTAAGTYRLLVEELTRRGGPDLAYCVTIDESQPGFALSVETERVEAAPGESFEIKVDAARHDFEGPIKLTVEGAGDGFSFENNILSKGSNAPVKVRVPAGLEPGRVTHLKLVGRAEIGGHECASTASTMPALRKRFPLTRYPPIELDGLIGLGIKPAPKSPEAKVEK